MIFISIFIIICRRKKWAINIWLNKRTKWAINVWLNKRTKWALNVQLNKRTKWAINFRLNKRCGNQLELLDTFGNCHRPVFSPGISQDMHEITNLWTFGLNWSSQLQENNERTKTLAAQICVLSEWEIISFSKTTYLQREPFLTMFYTINSSPLLITK